VLKSFCSFENWTEAFFFKFDLFLLLCRFKFFTGYTCVRLVSTCILASARDWYDSFGLFVEVVLLHVPEVIHGNKWLG
jgi:hypothetical protein